MLGIKLLTGEYLMKLLLLPALTLVLQQLHAIWFSLILSSCAVTSFPYIHLLYLPYLVYKNSYRFVLVRPSVLVGLSNTGSYCESGFPWLVSSSFCVYLSEFLRIISHAPTRRQNVVFIQSKHTYSVAWFLHVDKISCYNKFTVLSHIVLRAIQRLFVLVIMCINSKLNRLAAGSIPMMCCCYLPHLRGSIQF